MVLLVAQALERMMSPAGPSPNPNVPSEYCSTIPPLQQARAAGTLNSPPPTVMVPVSVLKHPNNDSMITLQYCTQSVHHCPSSVPGRGVTRSFCVSSGCPREQKRVWFADGILPNGEVADTTKLSVTSRRSSQEFSGVAADQTTVRRQRQKQSARFQKVLPLVVNELLVSARLCGVRGRRRWLLLVLLLLARSFRSRGGGSTSSVWTLGLRAALWNRLLGEEGSQPAAG